MTRRKHLTQSWVIFVFTNDKELSAPVTMAMLTARDERLEASRRRLVVSLFYLQRATVDIYPA